jgi:hypothetical protein
MEVFIRNRTAGLTELRVSRQTTAFIATGILNTPRPLRYCFRFSAYLKQLLALVTSVESVTQRTSLMPSSVVPVKPFTGIESLAQWRARPDCRLPVLFLFWRH